MPAIEQDGAIVEISVLGPLRVAADGDAVTIGRARCRAVLAFLVSRHPERVPAEVLAEALWPGARDGDKALNSARVHVHHLRRCLPGHDDALPAGDGGYRLSIPSDALDVARFADRAARARELTSAGEPAEALGPFERALAEWRGEAYADFTGLDVFGPVRTKLAEERFEVMHGYARGLLHAGAEDEVVRILAPIVADRPEREDLAACLMLGYFRVDRQTDALDLFGRVKETLAESGLRPGPALTNLAEAIVVEPESLSRDRPTTVTTRSSRPRRRDAIVGREHERRQLETALTSARNGRPQLVYVSGVAGMGKSSVVRRLVEDHPEAEVIEGECFGDGDAYQPFPDLVHAVVSAGEVSTTPPAVLSELARLSPALAAVLPAPLPAVEPDAGRARLFDAVTAVLTETHRLRVVVVEDLHWAGEDAIALLKHVVRAARGQLLVVGTYRTDMDGASPFGAARAGRSRLGLPDLDLTLAPMDEHETEALVDVLAPAHHRIGWDADVAALVDVSAGHPLRLVEVLKHLELDPDTPIHEVAPEDVVSLVRRRLGGMSELSQAVLRAASVVGRHFSLEVVATVVERSVGDTLRGIETAIDAGLVAAGGAIDEFVFAHPLYRNAVYDSVTPARLARLNLRIGALHELDADTTDAGAPWSDAARHLLGALPLADTGRVSRAAARAGDEAAARYAHVEAAGWYSTALEHAPSDERLRVRLRLQLGAALELGRDVAAAREQYFAALELATSLDDIELLVAGVEAATPRVGVLEPEFGLRLTTHVEHALTRTAPDDARRIALLRSAVVGTFYLDIRDPDDDLAELERLVAAHPSAANRRTLLGLRYMVEEGRSPETRIELAREICTYSTGPESVALQGVDDRRVLHELLRLGRTAEFDELLEQMHRRAIATSIPLHRHWASGLAATRRLMRETGPEVEVAIDAAAAFARHAGIRDAVGLQTLQTFVLRYQQGRTREVITGLTTPVDDAPPILAGISLLALSFAAAGRFDQARPILDRIVADEIRLPRNNFWFGAVAMLADVAASCGDDRQRDLLRAALAPIAEQFVVFGTGGAVLGTGHHWLARLAHAAGDDDAARVHLQSAARLCYDCDAPFWEHRARADLATLTP